METQDHELIILLFNKINYHKILDTFYVYSVVGLVTQSVTAIVLI